MYKIEVMSDIGLIKEHAVVDPNTFEIIIPAVMKSQSEIDIEKQNLLNSKAAEIQAKVDAYEAAKENQRQNGGPGPVADFEIMKICNEYNCQFEVVFKESN
jgi:hypothetical protein